LGYLFLTFFFLSVGRILQALMVGLVVGFSFWDIGVSTSDLNLRVLAIFQILFLG
jgi:ATP-binding cassette subfamily G (WHITE) protein 2 (SNQ2)